MHFMRCNKVYTLNSVVSSAHDITDFCSVNMDASNCRFSVARDTMEFEFKLLSPLLVWSTPLGLPGNVVCACTNIQEEGEEQE